MALGRISGPLLKANLLREGVPLAFENDLLYLDVENSRIGINNSNPQYALDVSGTTRTTFLESTTSANIGEISILSNIISTSSNELVLGVDDNVVYQKKLLVDDLILENNTIKTANTNSNLELRPNGTGSVEVYSDVNVYGNIYASGNIRADGNITIGNENTDTVTITARVTSNIIPDEDNTYTLGSSDKRWDNVWVNEFFVDSVITGDLTVDGVNLVLRQGNIYYVAENGDDTKTGDHPQDPFASLEQALSVAGAGDTVHIYPGTYFENFPLSIPAGVTVKGAGIRSVDIRPTPATQSNDAFLLNGETTVEDITISNFFYDSINDTGYAFRFDLGFTVTSRSPYVRNISVITQGSVTSGSDPRGFDAGDAGRGAYLDGAVAESASREAGCLFHSVTFITPGVDALTITNGVRIEWLNCFTYFAGRGMVALDGATGLKGAGRTAVRVEDVTGSYVAGETFTYYDTDGVTVLATGTIDTVDADGKFYVNGNLTGLLEAEERPGKTVTSYNSAALDTDEKKFGSASLLLNGVDNYIGVSANNDFGFGTDDFTIEAWVYKTASSGSETILDFRAGAGTDNAVALGVQGLDPYVYINGAYRIQLSGSITTNAWNHIAYVRSGTTGTLYLNGSSIGSWTDNIDYGTAKPLIIGSVYTGTASYWDGWLDEVRISKGVARYTGNFGVPTAEFASDFDTVLLLHFNGDDSSTTIVDDALNGQDLRFSGGATAKYVTLADTTDFGGELRSIASACVYGNIGAFGSGAGVLMYLISQNFAYIGTGKSVDNDANNVIQENEVVELNNAKIRYSSVDHDGDFRVGDLFFVDQQTGTVNFTSAEINVESTNGFTFTDGADTTIINSSEIQTGNIRISGNTVESIAGDVNISSASDQINLTNNVEITGNLDVVGNVTIGGNITIGDEVTDNLTIIAGINSDIIPAETSTYNLGSISKQWKNIYANRAVIDDVEINDNFIRTITSNADLELQGSGTGNILIDDLRFRDNEIVSNLDIILSSATETVRIDTSGSLNLPAGTTLERPGAPELGMIRYNTENDLFEGFDGNWISLSGVYDLDLDTRITAELTPGANDNTIRFYIQDNVISSIDSSGLNTSRVEVDDIVIDGNVIQSTPSNTDLILESNGTGYVQFEKLGFRDTTIRNTVTDSITLIENTGNGYFKIDGTAGFIFPVGTSLQRPLPAFTETGMTRFNTDDRRLEVFDGLGWESVAGASGAISAIDAEFLAVEIALTLG